MVTSTGRNSPVRHSTGAAGDHTKRKDHRRPRPRYSTSRASTISHFTGTKPDARRGEERARGQRPNRPPPGNRPSLRKRSGALTG